jgi:cytochrome c553
MKALLLGALCAVAMFVPRQSAAAPASQSESDHVLRSSPDVERGAKLFETCAGCHGAGGAGTLDGFVPRIAGQHFSVIVNQLLDYRHGKRWDPHMAKIANTHQLPDAQSIADVAGFVSRLPVPAKVGVGSSSLVAHGAQIYAERCAACHGRTGQGDAERQLPQIAAQNYEYLLRQLHDAVEGRRPNFSRAHVKLLEGFGRDEFVGVADYLSRARPRDSREPR